MNLKLKTALLYCTGFLVLGAVLFFLQWFLAKNGILNLDYRLHILLFALSCIVVLTVCAFYIFGRRDTLGFVYLGLVVFKMFGMGYLAYFEPMMRLQLIPYFVIFWIYLLAEAVIAIKLIQKQDKNHTKQI